MVKGRVEPLATTNETVLQKKGTWLRYYIYISAKVDEKSQYRKKFYKPN